MFVSVCIMADNNSFITQVKFLTNKQTVYALQIYFCNVSVSVLSTIYRKFLIKYSGFSLCPTGGACVSCCSMVVVRTFGVMYDHAIYYAYHELRHYYAYKMGSEPGGRRWPL